MEKLKLYQGTSFVDEPFPDVSYIIYPIVPAQSIVLMHGAPGVGKSALSWFLGDSVSKGNDFLGMKTSQCNVLLIQVDMTERILQARWKGSQYRPGFDVAIGDSFDCLSPKIKSLDDLLQVPTSKVYQLVIVDALARVITGHMVDDNLPNLVYSKFIKWFPAATILFIHHDRKIKFTSDGKPISNPQEAALGSQLWMAYATVAINLRNRNNFTILDHTKSQYSELIMPMKLTMDFNGITFTLWSKEQQENAKIRLRDAIVQLNCPEWLNLTEKERNGRIANKLGISLRQVYRIKAMIKDEDDVGQ